MRIFASCSLAAIAACASAVSAQTCGIHLFEIDKNVDYTQVSNSPPGAPDAWYVHAGFFFDIDDALSAASMTFNRPPLQTLAFAPAGPRTQQFYSSFYADRPSMDADFPSTTYTMRATCSSGTSSAGVFLPSNLFCAAIPTFMGDTFDRLQVYDTTQPFDVDINGFTVAPGANVGVTSVAISQDMVGGVFSVTVAPGDTQIQIPAGTLQPGAAHLISVSYTCLLHTTNAGFGGASSDAAFSRGTSIAFNTRPLSPLCVADVDDGSGTGTPDGGVGIEDLLYYLAIYDAGVIAADVDDGSGTGTLDGGVGIEDLLYYLSRYDAGC
jgi:hypothetical protein